MAEDRPEEVGSLPDPSRPKREPPTIDLDATDVSGEPVKANAEAQPEPEPESEPKPEAVAAAPDSEPAPEPIAQPIPKPKPISKPISPWVVAPVSGAVAAALVIGVGWLLGWPAVQPASAPAPQLNAAAIDDLTSRVAGLESKAGKPAADPTAATRTEALEKSLAALRGELAGQRAQSEKLAAAINEAKAAPRNGAAPLDLSGITARIDKIESAVRAQAAEIARQDSKSADAKPADDTPLRRVVAASLLDVAVRHGDAYVAPLSAAKAFADDPQALKPLDAFADKGVPSPNILCRELLEIVPKLSPPPPDTATTGSGLVDRLQAGAAKLVRIERTDAAGTDRGSVVARITAAALRNDLPEARRELKTLSPADSAPAQAWLDKTAAREAALAASRNFADNAMAALAKAGQ
jgi:hypothetical protein